MTGARPEGHTAHRVLPATVGGIAPTLGILQNSWLHFRIAVPDTRRTLAGLGIESVAFFQVIGFPLWEKVARSAG